MTLPGITSTFSLNGAAAHAKVEDGSRLLRVKRGTTISVTRTGSCPTILRHFLLTEVDNKQPFTLTARVTPTFLKDV